MASREWLIDQALALVETAQDTAPPTVAPGHAVAGRLSGEHGLVYGVFAAARARAHGYGSPETVAHYSRIAARLGIPTDEIDAAVTAGLQSAAPAESPGR